MLDPEMVGAQWRQTEKPLYLQKYKTEDTESVICWSSWFANRSTYNTQKQQMHETV